MEPFWRLLHLKKLSIELCHKCQWKCITKIKIFILAMKVRQIQNLVMRSCILGLTSHGTSKIEFDDFIASKKKSFCLIRSFYLSFAKVLIMLVYLYLQR